MGGTVIQMRVYKFLDARFGLKTLREKRLKISTLDDLNDPFELLAYEMTLRKKRKEWRNARKVWGRRRGLMCFSAGWRDPVIWAHYSNKHKGMCLGFEIPENASQKVRYVNSRLKLSDSLEVDDADAWLYTKYENWAYEQEIRCWTTLDTPSQGMYFMEFAPSLKLVEVIAGARSILTKSKILEAIKPLGNEVKLIKARAGFQRFEIVEDRRGLK
jgi:hypothetical protein